MDWDEEQGLEIWLERLEMLGTRETKRRDRKKEKERWREKKYNNDLDTCIDLVKIWIYLAFFYINKFIIAHKI